MTSALPDFDVLVKMARNDPHGLERLRRELTNAVIEGQEDEMKRQRLKGLAFRIDMERERAPTPLAACIRLSEMMCHSLADLHRSMVAPVEEIELAPAPTAEVLEFKPSRPLAEVQS